MDKTHKTIVQVVAENVQHYMDLNPDLQSGPKLKKKSGVSVGTVSRIINQQVATGIDTIEALARAFGCQPWELLVDKDATKADIVRRFLRED